MAKTKSTTKAKTGKQKLAAAAPSAPNIDIGITQGDRKKIADGLSRFQADAFTLYLKTHNFHWNVTGSMFNSLHTMFETQYTEQWAALDDVAERIRAAGAGVVHGDAHPRRAQPPGGLRQRRVVADLDVLGDLHAQAAAAAAGSCGRLASGQREGVGP